MSRPSTDCPITRVSITGDGTVVDVDVVVGGEVVEVVVEVVVDVDVVAGVVVVDGAAVDVTSAEGAEEAVDPLSLAPPSDAQAERSGQARNVVTVRINRSGWRGLTRCVLSSG